MRILDGHEIFHIDLLLKIIVCLKKTKINEAGVGSFLNILPYLNRKLIFYFLHLQVFCLFAGDKSLAWDLGSANTFGCANLFAVKVWGTLSHLIQQRRQR